MKHGKVTLLMMVTILVVPFLSACRETVAGNQPATDTEETSAVNEIEGPEPAQPAMANPAAVYCRGLGYSMVDRLTPAGMDADCLVQGEFQCGQWDFLAGRCGREYSFCELNGGELVQDDGNIGRCLFVDGSSCIEFAYFQGDCQPSTGGRTARNDIESDADQVQHLIEDAATLEQVHTMVEAVPVVGWLGYVVSTPAGAQFDDYVVILPEGEVGQFGIDGSTETVGKQIAALRDHPQPGKYAHFWGSLACDVMDYSGCQLLVDHLRVDGPGDFLASEPVDGWQGAIVSLPHDGPGAPQPDDAFVLAGDYPLHYGLDSAVAENSGELVLAPVIASLRDSQQVVRLWGQLRCGVPDAGGCHIAVERIEAGDQVYEMTAGS